MPSKSYIVDLGLTMLKSPTNNTNNTHLTNKSHNHHLQELHCDCGAITRILGKIKRNVALYQEKARDYNNHINEFDQITCEKCNKTYPDFEKVHLLEPGVPKLISVTYKSNKNNHINNLVRERVYVNHNGHKMEFISIYDQLQINTKTNKTKIFIDNSRYEDGPYMISCNNDKCFSKKNNINISCEITLANLYYINQFFGFSNQVNYYGLQDVFEFFKDIDFILVDINKIKEIPQINDFYNTYKIFNKLIDHPNAKYGQKINYEYRLINDIFNKNEFHEEKLHYGEYLESISELARIFVSVIGYSHITTLLLTKGYFFLDEFLKSNYALNNNIYKKYKATYPSKIIDISISKFQNRKLNDNLNNEVKVSNIIYKYIRKPDDIDLLRKIYEKNFLKKIEIEGLFQSYNNADVFKVFDLLTVNQSNLHINIKHVRHLLNHKYHINYPGKNFIEIYSDTISTLRQIIENQDKIRDLIKIKMKENKKFSKEYFASYQDYLNVKESTFFEIRTGHDLKRKHDELSCIHAIFVDLDKANAYIESMEKLDFLNDEIDEVSFTVINNIQEIHKEHIVMDHCIQTYVDKVIKNIFIPIRIFDKTSNERATLGIHRNNFLNNENEKVNFTFNQLKGYKNSRATKFLIDRVIEYCKKHNIYINKNDSFYIDLQANTNEELKMPDYLSDEEIKIARDHIVSGRITSKNAPISKAQAFSIIEKFKNK